MICNTFNNYGLAGPASPNRITYSVVNEFETTKYRSPSYGIKYVLSGTEYYGIDKKEFAVTQKRFLLVNDDQALDILVRSKKNVTGFCIHVDQRMLQNVHSVLSQTEDFLLTYPLESGTPPQFDELLYSENENNLGKYLQVLAQKFDPYTSTIDIEKEEIFFNISKYLLELQNHLPKRNALNVSKNSTQQELIHRLAIAKEILDSTIDCCNIEEVAKTSMLSPAHLYRSFKKVYQVSPYQYLLKRRLQRAAGLLMNRDQNITEIAFQCGFPDLASFSKAFKKEYGYSPKSFALQFV